MYDTVYANISNVLRTHNSINFALTFHVRVNCILQLKMAFSHGLMIDNLYYGCVTSPQTLSMAFRHFLLFSFVYHITPFCVPHACMHKRVDYTCLFYMWLTIHKFKQLFNKMTQFPIKNHICLILIVCLLYTSRCV